MTGLPDVAALRAEATRRQRAAADPSVSAWVSANAGTGKTHVLVQRVLRLLLAGTQVGSILSITFTKAAAAEMSNRLIRELGRWAALSDGDLRATLAALLEREPSADELDLARCLFAEVLDAPGGLKIMTIHAFCDRVLRRFPLEAGVPPGFSVLTDEDRRALMREATDAVLTEAATAPESALGRALLVAVAQAGESRFDTLLQAALAKWGEIARAILRQCDDNDAFAGVEVALRAALGLGRDASVETIQAERASVLPDATIASVVQFFPEGAKTDQGTASLLATARGASPSARITAFRAALLTKEGTARARLATKAIREKHPTLVEELETARDRFAALEINLRAAESITATAALLRLADAVLQHYEHAKIRSSALDFDALIAKTAALFQKSDASAWVLYRLDADLTHILVDEAQDTSPAQWALIEALTTEFFSGAGAEEVQRTLFAVGDEKQSIYSFQGADPERFAEAGESFAARARDAGERWEQTPLTLSFRSTSAVLDAVDLVFADPARTRGTGDGSGQGIKHNAHRQGEAGLVEIWPVIKAEKAEPGPAWDPFAEEASEQSPSVQVANRVARQIRQWLDAGEILESRNRPIRAGDILILVRKRAPFAAPMVKALKDHDIPVAGADRLRLTSQLAVMDLMILGDVMLLPYDDLALATLLKSPFFEFDDDDLFAIGYDRDHSFWEALNALAENEPRFAEAVARLTRWRALATQQKPYEFYMERLEAEGLRAVLVARLGAEATDAIAEFLNLAIAYEAGRAPSLQGFLHWLRVSDPEVKRDMEQGRDEVRVMTVHGAKGLEANVVFLPDTCGSSSGRSSDIVMVEGGPDMRGTPVFIGGNQQASQRVPIWALPGASLVPQIAEAREATRRAEAEEHQRLLYVAMTRARDRLYIAGFEGSKGRSADCWYNLVTDGLAEQLAEFKDADGHALRCMSCAQTVPVSAAVTTTAAPQAAPLPDWAHRPAPVEHAGSRLAPSRIGVSQPGGSPVAGQAVAHAASEDEALLRGRLVHRLLELLPELPTSERSAAGAHFLAAEAAALTAGRRDELLAGLLHILETPHFAAVFGPGSRAEVPLTAELPRADSHPVVLSGQIDRLIVGESEIVAVDFKTGASIPRRVEWTPFAHLAQLAAYRLVLRNLFPGKSVRAALLWTSAPLLVEIPNSLLDAAEPSLYIT